MEVQRGQYSTRDSAAIDPHDGLEVTVEQLAVGTRQGLQWFAGVENFVMTGQTEVQRLSPGRCRDLNAHAATN